MYRLRLSPLHLAFLRKGYTPINPAFRMRVTDLNNQGRDLARLPINPDDVKEQHIKIDLGEMQSKQIKILLETVPINETSENKNIKE